VSQLASPNRWLGWTVASYWPSWDHDDTMSVQIAFNRRWSVRVQYPTFNEGAYLQLHQSAYQLSTELKL
jgi:hypothetical protein